MYRTLPLELLVPNPDNPNRISRTYAKKLRHNIEELGLYETLTVRPDPHLEGKYEVLDGHARLKVLAEIGSPNAKCDVWEVTDSQAQLFLAVLNKLKGSDVPELRMNLLFSLLQTWSKEELAGLIPETASYLAKLEKLPEELEGKEAEAPSEKTDIVVVDFYLTSSQHEVLSTALRRIAEEYDLPDSSQALVKMAELYLAQCGAS